MLNVFSEKTAWILMHMLFRIAVPFYLVTSAYFVGLKLKKCMGADGVWNPDAVHETFKRYRHKLFPPFLFWGSIGLILFIRECIFTYKYSVFGTVIRCIRQVLFYPLGAMWFIAALIVSSHILEWWLIKKKGKVRSILIISIILYLAGLVANTYYFLIAATPLKHIVDFYLRACLSARNGVFLLFFFVAGVIIALRGADTYKNRLNIVFLLIFYCMLLIETLFSYGRLTADDNALFISFIVLIPTIVIFAIRHRVRENKFIKQTRSLSKTIYFVHPCAAGILGAVGLPYGVGMFMIVLVICLLLWIIKIKSNIKLFQLFF